MARFAGMEGVDSFDGLAKAAGDGDSRVREAALIALGGLGDPRAMELHLAAVRDRDAKVRQAAVGYLHDDGTEKTHTAVSKALRDSDPVVRSLAARFLQRSTWHPKDVDDEICLAVADGDFVQAASHGAAAIEPLERVLEGGGFSQQAAAAEALGTIKDERVLPPLRRAAKSSDLVVCLAAIGALANVGRPDVLKDLVPLFTHNDHRIRAAAIEAAVKVGCDGHVGVLCASLKDSKWEVRCAAAEALGKVKDVSTVDALMPLLKDESPEVRAATTAALGELGKRQRASGSSETNVTTRAQRKKQAILAVFTELLGDGDADLRLAAVDSIKHLGGAETRPPLMTALLDTDEAVRLVAAQALTDLGIP